MNANNKVISLHTTNSIDDEASIWLVRLDNGNLSNQSRKELKAWLLADKRHPAALNAMADVWDGIDEVLINISDEKTSAKVSLWPVIKPIFKPFALAASVSFVAIFIWFAMPENIQRNSYATLIGQQMDATFDDGSIIHLNTNSRIETEFTDDKRVIKLIKGEALFEVAHDPSRPFIVYAGNRLVQAIGTKFVVHLAPENIQVTVTDGKVKMSKVALNTELADIKELNNLAMQKDDVYIAKGEKVIVGSNQAPKLTHINPDSIERELSWLDGKLIFDNEELFDVIEEINRYLDIQIVLKDPSLHNIPISGRFDLKDSEALIEAIELSFNMTSQQLGSNKILLTKKI
ncbi:FecR domain-containing protein [Colwellia sp. MSW7]|jgi:transmembrane sensor|uniref:FecR domain-containing protein n=1 Tax=Colwellia maritima TaxID=2912588 RepID=A0ABS9X3L2_9GAMM|nr:FecR domain-containing protein [Colwellia maritima]MCI2284815.1 FecR domain-containing protein [Colwellia maritima]